MLVVSQQRILPPATRGVRDDRGLICLRLIRLRLGTGLNRLEQAAKTRFRRFPAACRASRYICIALECCGFWAVFCCAWARSWSVIEVLYAIGVIAPSVTLTLTCFSAGDFGL